MFVKCLHELYTIIMYWLTSYEQYNFNDYVSAEIYYKGHHDYHLLSKKWPWNSVFLSIIWKYNNAKRSIPAHPTFVNDAHCGLHLWPVTSKINRVHPLTMVNMSAKFDEEAHNGLVSIVFTSLFQYISIVTLTFDLWSPKSIGFILSLWLRCLPSLMKKHTTV